MRAGSPSAPSRIRGQRVAGQGGSAHRWMEAGQQRRTSPPITRQPEAPACPKLKSRRHAATAENHSSQCGVFNVTRHLLQQPLWRHPLRYTRQMPSRLHQVPQPQLSRLPVRDVCPSFPAALGVAMQPPTSSPVPKTTGKSHLPPPPGLCTTTTRTHTPQQTLPGQPAAGDNTLNHHRKTCLLLSQSPGSARFVERQFCIGGKESWFPSGLQQRPQPCKNLRNTPTTARNTRRNRLGQKLEETL